MKPFQPLYLSALFGLIILGGCLQQNGPPLSKEEQLAKEKAELLRPFDKPHRFEPEGEGYTVIFPAKPTTPQFRDIMHDGSHWLYEEKQRLGLAEFSVVRTARRPWHEPGPDRRDLDWFLVNFKKDWQKALRAEPGKTRITERYFKFDDKYEAVEVMVHYQSPREGDAQKAKRLCRHVSIVAKDDSYRLQADGVEDLIVSPLVDAFFDSFELRPKPAPAK